MNRLTLLAFLALFLVACSQTSANTATQVRPTEGQAGKDFMSPNSVEISNFNFSPNEITIKQGESVVWTNQDSAPHTVTSDSGKELNSEKLNTGQSYSHTFDAAGTYEYHCGIHTSMKGKVIVE